MDDESAAIGRIARAPDEAARLQPVDQRRHAATGKAKRRADIARGLRPAFDQQAQRAPVVPAEPEPACGLDIETVDRALKQAHGAGKGSFRKRDVGKGGLRKRGL
ncbi:hypothetical protein EH32_04680 [Erythrobacter litoralis]|uniref:Uncharacterized protein n=1 Tax=Erythrobacter litoralis TaxID=39960 RepID=A0A074N2T4_9SPHN|nr:hypothetical protein [Erythrobacter litoralis]KEO99120.1 hypothetical protein EH32_04680 [Erythrobacter litoralis]